MFKLICKSSFVLFRVIASGSQKLGLLITEGRLQKSENKTLKNETHWFDVDEKERLITFTASIMRVYLDREYYHPNFQPGLFENSEISSKLLDTEEEEEEALFLEAYHLALKMPTTVKWKTVILAGPALCSICSDSMTARSIAHVSLVASPAGLIMHTQCPDCRTGFSKITTFQPQIAEQLRVNPKAGAA